VLANNDYTVAATLAPYIFTVDPSTNGGVNTITNITSNVTMNFISSSVSPNAIKISGNITAPGGGTPLSGVDIEISGNDPLYLTPQIVTTTNPTN
jgi:hypothetical protein